MKKIAILIFFLFFLNKNYSQSLNILPESPNARAIAEYGKIPVDMYRGKPQITVPIFSDDKTFNIALDYNLNSVKPSTVPTWVGLGWNLNTGGAITRIVNSLPDELYTKESTPYNLRSYLDNSDQYLNSNNWSSLATLQTYYNNSLASINSPALYTYDIKTRSAPDEFIINIMGITGSFYMNEKQQWVGRTRDGHTFKIEHIYKNDFVLKEKLRFREDIHTIKRILYGFNIIMDNGTRYIFGQNDNNIEFVNNVPDTKSYNDEFNSRYIPTSWYIDEIIYPTGKKMKFTYERDNWATFIPASGGYTTKYWKKNNSSSTFENSIGGYKFLSSLYNVYLKKVESESFTIDFRRSLSNSLQYKIEEYTPAYQQWGDFEISRKNNLFKLDEITIYTPANKKINNISFYYNNSPTERLHLENIIINNTEKYGFIYNPLKLPEYTTKDVDSWKFNRGPSSNPNFNAITATPEQYETAWKMSDIPNLDYTKAEILEKIIYPTGGHTDFEYELNEYSKYGDKDKNYDEIKLNSTNDTQAGGLRIKKITKCPLYNLMDCNETMYSYKGDDGKSSGILPLQFNRALKATGDNYYLWTFSNDSYQSLKDDNSICYSKVTEIESNGGGRETYFTNFDSSESNDMKGINYFYGYPNSENFFNQLPYTSLSYMRGKVLKEIIFASPTKKIKTTEYKYIKLNNYIRSYSILDYIAGRGIPLDDSGNDTGGALAINDFNSKVFFFVLSAYNINLDTSFLTQKETEYENNKTIDKYSYEYEYNNLLKQETTLADNNIHTINYTYASSPYLKDKYMVGIPLIRETTNTVGGITKTIAKTEIKYPLSETDAKSRNIQNLDIPVPFDSFSQDLNSSLMDKDITYDKYDQKGNLIQYTLRPDPTGQGLSTTIIWGYNNLYPIAKIEGAKYDDIKSKIELVTAIDASNEDAIKDSNNDETSLLIALKNLRNSVNFKDYLVTTYTYDPLVGVRSMTSPNGVTTSYIYDSVNKLKQILDSNGNIVKEYNYNYNTTKFYNEEKSQTFQKSDCSNGQQGTYIQYGGYHTYTVPANKYVSLISKEDANKKALDDIAINGQVTANINAQCYNQNCGLTAGNNINLYGAHNEVVQIAPSHFRVETQFLVSVGNSYWTSLPAALTIGQLCSPNNIKTVDNIMESGTNRKWKAYIYPNGNVTLSLVNGMPPPASTSMRIIFEYDKN